MILARTASALTIISLGTAFLNYQFPMLLFPTGDSFNLDFIDGQIQDEKSNTVEITVGGVECSFSPSKALDDHLRLD